MLVKCSQVSGKDEYVFQNGLTVYSKTIIVSHLFLFKISVLMKNVRQDHINFSEMSIFQIGRMTYDPIHAALFLFFAATHRLAVIDVPGNVQLKECQPHVRK